MFMAYGYRWLTSRDISVRARTELGRPLRIRRQLLGDKTVDPLTGSSGRISPSIPAPEDPRRRHDLGSSWRISSAYRKPHTCWQHRAALYEARLTDNQHDSDLLDPDSQGPCRRPAGRYRGDRRALGDRLPATRLRPPRPRLRPRPQRPHLPFSRWQRARRRLGEDGSVPDGVTVFDDEVPAWPTSTARCPPPGCDGCRGPRSRVLRQQWLAIPEYQSQLLREAVSKYGSEDGGRPLGGHPQHVCPRVRDAVDIGRQRDGVAVLKHGAEYGLCQIYINEPWH